MSILLAENVTDDGKVMTLQRVWDHGLYDVQYCAIGRSTALPENYFDRPPPVDPFRGIREAAVRYRESLEGKPSWED